MKLLVMKAQVQIVCIIALTCIRDITAYRCFKMLVLTQSQFEQSQSWAVMSTLPFLMDSLETRDDGRKVE